MVILLTGASGFVGTAVGRRLEERGLAWRGLVRDREKAAARGLAPDRLIFGDLRDLPAAALDDVDRVVHVAGLVRGRPEELRAVNCEAARHLAAALGERVPEARFVHVSSLAAIGPSTDGVGTGRGLDLAAPVSEYGRSKLDGERAVADTAVSWITLRPGVVYGPWDTDVFVLFRMAEKGVMPVVGRKSRYSLVHVDDLADACLAALDAPELATRAAYPVVHGEVLEQEDWLRRIAAAVGRNPRLFTVPRFAAWFSALLGEGASRLRGRAPLFGFDKFREMKQGSWVGDPDPAATAFGWRARVAHDEGFRQTAAWYREANWLRSSPRAASNVGSEGSA